ncbi:MAG: efflux RND transporter permease subunit [Verrucomicrobia bacterium]|nr:efflux RND transporter permease subunit [Verrucomicrobiota bacterium]
MNISAPFIRRPVMTTLVMCAIILMGILAFKALPVTDLPSVEYPLINVHAMYTGASPEVMASQVAAPIEKELLRVNGVKNIYSQSSRGMTWMTVVFTLDRDINEAVQDVQVALKRADNELPPDMEQRPLYFKANAHGESIIYLILSSESASLAELYDVAHQRIEQRLARIDGVGKVEVHGSPYAVRIYLNPEQMAGRGVTFEEVKTAITQATGSAPLGRLDTEGRKFTLEVPSRLCTAADFQNLALTPQVRLKEIAEVRDGLESEDIFRFLTPDKSSPTVIIGIQKQNTANAVRISEDLQKMLPDIQSEIPTSMQLLHWFDKTNWIKEAIEDVEWTLIFSFFLVVSVIYFTLRRLRETMIAATALPLSVIGTFIVMHLLHFNIDILSLLALTLSMGFVIDDAIVVLENIVRHREKGLPRMEAAFVGSQQISFTVLSMTLSLVAVFIPLLFMQDVTGRLFREFSVTLAVAILVSGFVSLFLTPMLCSKFSSAHLHVPQKESWLLRMYRPALHWCLSHKKTTLSMGVVTVGLTVFLFRFLPMTLFPEEDRGTIWSFVQMPSGMSKSYSDAYQEKLNAIVQKHPGVESFIALNFKDFQIYFIRLLEASKRPSQATIVTNLQKQLNDVPGTSAFLRGMQLISAGEGGFTQNSYSFVLKGPDMDEVRRGGEALKQKLASHPMFGGPDLSTKADDPKLDVLVFEDEAQKLGLTRQSIQTLLQSAYSGGSIGKIDKGSEQYKVFLELAPEFQKSTSALAKLYLKTPEGTAVPLKAVAEWKEGVGLQTVDHVDALPSTTLFFDIAKGIKSQDAFAELQKVAKEILPPSVTGKFEGMADVMQNTSNDAIWLLLLAIVAMYVVLGILYESFIHPLTILSALPFACLGGVLTLLIFREPLSLYSMVGFLLLIGIVKKNGIMMIDYAIETQRSDNRSAFEAIKEACFVRFRPIMMTTVAAVMGALPIAIGIGAGAETRRGLGLVIAGGLIFSQFLTLFLTPILYLYLEKIKKKPLQ